MADVQLDTTVPDRMIPLIPGKIDSFLRYEATEIVNDVKRAINEISMGETVVRYSPKRTVTVSREGDAPNTDTGALINSIKWTPVGQFAIWVHDGVLYGLPLEQVYNRPFMAPAFENRRKVLKDD